MIVYKVVEKNTRNGSNVAMIKEQFSLSSAYSDFYEKFLKFRKENEQFFPKYLKGTIVKCAEGSVGIICFKDKWYAKDFINNYDALRKTIIIKVKGINKMKTPVSLVYGCGGTNIININKEAGMMSPPHGTITFKAVEVLE